MKLFNRRPKPIRYQIRQKLFAFGDDFYIENDQGQRVFKVDGKVLRVRETLDFRGLDGHLLCQIQERKLRIKDVMAIDGPDGRTIAEVKKALITPLRDRFVVNIKDAPDMDIHGNIVDHEYTIEVGRHKVAEISKKGFRVRDMYGVEVEPGQNDILILAVSVAVDMLVHPGN
jgi:uncharacterized protein YxjI